MRRTLAVALLVCASAAARAEDPIDLKAESASRVEAAKPLLVHGNYFDAVANLRKAVEADPTNGEAVLLLAGVLHDTGEDAKALEMLGPWDKSPAALTLKSELLLLRGDDAGAEAAARAAVALDEFALPALVALGRVQEATGRRDDALETYEDVKKRWAQHDDGAKDGDDVLLALARARAAEIRLSAGSNKGINSVITPFEAILKNHAKDGEPPPAALVELGDLYLADFQHNDAKRWYEKALAKNPHYAPALFGSAKRLAFIYQEVEAAKICEDQVLRENPTYLPALLFLAQQALGDGDLAKAQPLIDRALAASPKDAEALATKAALAFLKDDVAGFESDAKAILARDKFASAAYAVLGRALEEQRRFAEAYAFAKRAIAVDPIDWNAQFLAGRNALNVGEDEQAREFLEAAEKGDAFENVYRHNFLQLFKSTRDFSVHKDAAYVVRIPPDEDEPFYRLLRRGLDRSIADLEKHWSFVAEKPLFAAVFDKQEDFATRTIGLPGFPALGACFGRVLTLDSPRALPPGNFAWWIVQHHELAHVITLQLSKGRVPRWLTEGLSVYEERRAGPVWHREMERDLIDAIWSDDVLTLKDANNAFRGPRVLYAYYQGGLMSELIERDFGFPALREMVRLFGDGLTTPEVVRKALKIEPEEFDRRFLVYAKDLVKDIHVLRRPTRAKIEKLKKALRKTPDDLEGWILLAEGEVARSDETSALSALAGAVKIAPQDGRVAAVRALVAWNEGRPDQAVQHAEEAVAKGGDLYELRMGLAEHYAKPGRDVEKAKEHYRAAIKLFPLQDGPRDPRLLLAKILLAEGEKNIDEVRRLVREHVDIDENDIGDRKQLAKMYGEHDLGEDELLMLEQLRDLAPLPNKGWSRQDALDVHHRLAEIYTTQKRYDDAELAFACAVGVARMPVEPTDKNPPLTGSDMADLLAGHAESLMLLGRADDARAKVAEALRNDPENEAAKKLMKSLER